MNLLTSKPTFALLLVLSLVLAGCSAPGIGGGGNYPSQDVTLIVPYEPAGSADIIGRQFANQMEKCLDTSVVVENRPGGGTTVGTNAVVTAQPNGYTIGLATAPGLTYEPLVQEGLSYDNLDDYEALVKLYEQPFILFVSKDAPWQSMADFTEDAKASPGKVQVAVSGAGTAPDLAVQQFAREAGLDIQTVPFSGGGAESVTAVVSGQLDAVSASYPTARGQLEAGNLRPLGVFSDQPFPPVPNAEPVPQGDLPGSYGIIAPNNLPEDVRSTLQNCTTEVVKSDEFQNFVKEQGVTPGTGEPGEFEQELQQFSQLYPELVEYLEQKQ